MKKKILLLNSLYLPNIGGVENSLSELIRIYSNDGYKVYLLASDLNLANSEILTEFSETECLTVYRYKVVGVSYFTKIKNCYFLLRKLMANNDFSLVISRGYITSFCATLLNVKFHYLVPSVIYYQELPKLKEKSFIGKIKFFISSLIQILSFIKPNLYVFSENMREQVSKCLLRNKEIHLTNFGVNRQRFHLVSNNEKLLLRSELGFSPNDVILLCLGRFSVLKDFNKAILSLLHLDEKYKICLVGEGPELDNYLSLVKSKGLCSRVFYFPSTFEPEVYFKAADIFMMTSYYESFGQTLLEATCSGLPVVAFKSSNEVKTNTSNIYSGFETLCVFSLENNPYSLARAVVEASNCKVSEREISEFTEMYSWENLALRMLKDYR